MLYRGSLCPSKNFRFQVRRLVELWATVGFPLHQLARQPQPQPAAQKDPQSPVVHGGRDPSIRGSRRTKPGCQLASAHVKQTPMCAKPRIGRACRRLRMSLSGLWLHHGLRGGCAAREPEAVTGATPIFRCLVWHLGGLGCAYHPNLPGGRSESISPLQEGQRALEAAVFRPGGGGYLGNGVVVGLAPMPDGSANGLGGETQPEGAA